MAVLKVTVEDKSGLIKAAVRAARIETLREIAAELNARADVLEAVQKSRRAKLTAVNGGKNDI